MYNHQNDEVNDRALLLKSICYIFNFMILPIYLDKFRPIVNRGSELTLNIPWLYFLDLPFTFTINHGEIEPAMHITPQHKLDINRLSSRGLWIVEGHLLVKI